MSNEEIPIKLNSLVEKKELYEFKPFIDWYDCLLAESRYNDQEIQIRSISIQQVDRFKGNKIGFVKLLVDSFSIKEKATIPGIVILRGGSVSILFIIESDDPSNKEGPYLILTCQPRLAVPSFNLLELPAGMLDGSGEFQGKAAQELYEETGLKINKDELINLMQGKRDSLSRDQCSPENGVLTSPGFTDERLHLFHCRKKLPSHKIQELQGKLTGERESGELISLKLIPLEDIYTATSDIKVLASMALYSKFFLRSTI
ncbi:hypothetical protein DSO57_1014222 [Entomophthora muscae]|nr:hypothetical protein DSO57_1014222 [Entomophthora muscae]